MNGTSYGIPWYVETRLVYYRTDLAKKAGYTTPPKDWAGLKAMAKAMQDKAGAKWGIGLQAGGTGSWQSVMPFAWSNGANLSKDGKSYSFDTPEMQEAVKYYQSYFTDGISDKAAPATPTTEPDFVSGKVPMFISGPWEMSAVEKVGGKGFKDKYSVAVMPDEEDVLLLRRWLRLRGLQGLQAARHGVEVREVPLRPQDAGRSGTSSRPTCPRSPAAWKDPSISADTKLAKFGEQLKTAQAPPSFPTWEQVVAAVRHRDGEGHQAGQRPGGRAEVRADAGRVDRDRPDPMTTDRARTLPRDCPGR